MKVDKMSNTPLLTKYEFVSLMEQKLGPYFTIGWLTSAWELSDQEKNIIQSETKILMNLPDYKRDAYDQSSN
jgi:hypothetical protein